MAEGTDLQQALRFFDYTERDRKLLARLETVLEDNADNLVGAFYRHLLSFPATRRLLRHPDVSRRLLGEQREYLLSLAGPVIDDAYVERRRRIGEVHERIGLDPLWYMGAYALYLSLLIPLVHAEGSAEPERAEETVAALAKVLLFDSQLAMRQYIQRGQQGFEYLNRELAASGQRLAKSLERTDAALRRTTERAEAAERLASIGTLVAGLAHEIGTPMGVIQGHASLLESSVRDDGLWRLKTIQEQIGRISRIIQGLLNMARPTRREPTPVDLSALVDNTLAFLTEKLSRRGIEAVRDFGQVPSVVGDPERLQQLFLNLFLNAADAMPDGGRLRIVLAPVELGTEVEIRVQDEGAGIPEEQLAQVFDPFFTTKEAGVGNGLGLAVAHGIVAEHRGAIEVSRLEPKGTEFRIQLPTRLD